MALLMYWYGNEDKATFVFVIVQNKYNTGLQGREALHISAKLFKVYLDL